MNSLPLPDTVQTSAPPSADTVRNEYAALPADAQYAAAQFIAFLRQGPQAARANGGGAASPAKRKAPKPRVPLSQDPAVGMWKNRKDMEDSVEYVRELRRKHWGVTE